MTQPEKIEIEIKIFKGLMIACKNEKYSREQKRLNQIKETLDNKGYLTKLEIDLLDKLCNSLQ